MYPDTACKQPARKKHNSILQYSLLALIAQAYTTNSLASEAIYVAADENAGRCSIKSNSRSLSRALSAAEPGDTIYLLPGIHQTAVNFEHGGEKNKPITLTYTPRSEQCPDGGKLSAIIDCAPEYAGKANCIEINYSHVVVDGLEVRNAAYNGIKVDGDVNGNPNRESYGNWGGYNERNYNVNGAANVIISNNYVHHIGNDGLKIGHANQIYLLNNDIYKTGVTGGGQGIDLVGVYDSVIRGNYVHDDMPYTMNKGYFDKGGSQNILIENNVFKDMETPEACLEVGGDTEWYNTRYTASEFDFDINKKILDRSTQTDENNLVDNASSYVASKMAESRHAIVRGNVIINCDPPLSFRNTYNARVYNNTVINSGYTQGWIKLWDDGNHQHTNVNLQFYNNLMFNQDRPHSRHGVFQDKNAGENPSNIKGLVFTNNLLHSMGSMPKINLPSSVASRSDQLDDAPRLDKDYHPEKNSPVIDKGADLIKLGIAKDRFTDPAGTLRPAGKGFDIGAFEYNK